MGETDSIKSPQKTVIAVVLAVTIGAAGVIAVANYLFAVRPGKSVIVGGGAVSTDSFDKCTFDTLSGFEYAPSAAGGGQLPENIRALDGRKVSITGFMFPVEMDDECHVKRFFLVKNLSLCCFGRTPKMNEWIDVAMQGEKTVEAVMDIPIIVSGVIQVGEVVERGRVVSIYKMSATDVVQGDVILDWGIFK